MGGKGGSALLHQQAHDAGAQVGNLLVGVGDARHVFTQVGLAFLGEEAQQQVDGLVGADDFEFVAILDVHDLVADVVGSLDDIDEGMAAVAVLLKPDEAQFVGNAFEDVLLGGEKAELTLLAGMHRRVRVFDDGSQRRIGHRETAGTTSLELVDEGAQRVGVALKVDEVVPLLDGELVLEFQTAALAEVSPDGLFARMAERRVAQVVRQAGGSDDFADVT